MHLKVFGTLNGALTRAVGRLRMAWALLLAGALYAIVALALPLGTGANGPLVLVCNVIGALLGLTVVLAWLYPTA